jgi:hypothetical protein
MNPKSTLFVRVAAGFIATIFTHVFAVDVQDAKVTRGEDGRETLREYVLTTNGKPDDRFVFTAQQIHSLEFGFRWDLSVMPSNTGHWASDITFKEYTEVIYRCVDRFVSDVPNGRVRSLHFGITYDSPIWQDIKKKLIPILENRIGSAVGFPKEADRAVIRLYNTSPVMKEIGDHIAKRVKRQFSNVMFESDGLKLERRNREDYTRTWQDVIKLPGLSLDMYSIAADLGFEPIQEK